MEGDRGGVKSNIRTLRDKKKKKRNAEDKVGSRAEAKVLFKHVSVPGRHEKLYGKALHIHSCV